MSPVARATLFRSTLARRAALLILDNAGSAEQVRPLLPGGDRILTLITSRDSLPGLVALDGARRIDLRELPDDDAVHLLRLLIGDRVVRDAAAAITLAAQCAGLPLTLRIAAEMASASPAMPLAQLVRDLAEPARRLRLMDAGGDSRAAVRSVLSWSYRALPPTVAWTFRTLGMHVGADLDVYAAAALTDASVDEAHAALERLARHHLVWRTDTDRYQWHDLLQAYAAEQAGVEDEDEARQAAVTRLHDYYLTCVILATRTLHPAEDLPAPPSWPVTDPTLQDSAAALAWLDSERHTLIALCAHAVAHGRPARAVSLARALFRYLDCGHFSDALIVHGHALEAALTAGEALGEANAQADLCLAYWRLSHHRLAMEHGLQALTRFRQLGELAGEARTLCYLGFIEDRQGRYEGAIARYEEALLLHRRVADRRGEANVRSALGLAHQFLGRHRLAEVEHRRALELMTEIGHPLGEAQALGNLAVIVRRTGQLDEAIQYHERALPIFRELGDLPGQAVELLNLALLELERGRPTIASDHNQEALMLYQQAGDRYGEAQTLNALGELRGRTDPTGARELFESAFAIAAATGHPDQLARAHVGLAEADAAAALPDAAHRHLTEALTLYTGMGAPEAEHVRERLAAVAASID